MTEKQLPLIDAEEIERYTKPPKPRKDWFIVTAYNSAASYWSLRQGWFTDIEQARQLVTELSDVWTHSQIIKIPGEKNDERTEAAENH